MAHPATSPTSFEREALPHLDTLYRVALRLTGEDAAAQDLVQDTFRSRNARQRPFLNADAVLANFDTAGRFSRKVWGLLSLELWHQMFHDRGSEYRRMLAEMPDPAPLSTQMDAGIGAMAADG